MGSLILPLNMLTLILFTFSLSAIIHYNEANSEPRCPDCLSQPCRNPPVCCKSGWFMKDNCCGCKICAKAEGDYCHVPMNPKYSGLDCAPGLLCVPSIHIGSLDCLRPGQECTSRNICVKSFTFVEVPKVCYPNPTPSTSSSRPPYYYVSTPSTSSSRPPYYRPNHQSAFDMFFGK